MNDNLVDYDPYNFKTFEEFIGFYHPGWLIEEKERENYHEKTGSNWKKKRMDFEGFAPTRISKRNRAIKTLCSIRYSFVDFRRK